MTDGDPLSPQVRLLEARGHLERTRAALDRDDGDAVQRVEGIIADIDVLREAIARTRGEQGRRQEAD